jgi:hypothetical protein
MALITAVMPVGPRTRPEFLSDSMESLRCWADDARIILVDDSGEAVTRAVARKYGAEVVTTAGNGPNGGLYLSLSLGFEAALASPFDLLLRLDTDALVAGSAFQEHAMRFFAEHPDIGCIGSYRYDYRGHLRSRQPQNKQIVRNLTVGWLRRPSSSAAIASLLARAKIGRRSYQLGESVLGGACLYSPAAIEALSSRGLLGIELLHPVGLGEDHLFAILLAAAGFGLADMARKQDGPIFGVKHVGLPASPEELIAEGKCLIHSVRSWGEMSEEEIRARFASARRKGSSPNPCSRSTP